jgi:hypothetical protein
MIERGGISMGYQHQFHYALEEGMALLPGLLSLIPSGAIQIAFYVLTSMALYSMAKRRGINNCWLSWVPMLNVWILGSLSDQYRYVVKGQYRSKRKVLIILEIIAAVLAVAMLCMGIGILVEITEDMINTTMHEQQENERAMQMERNMEAGNMENMPQINPRGVPG